MMSPGGIDNISANTPQQQSAGSQTPGNSSLLTIVKAQMVFLLSTLTEENFERHQTEIRALSDQHGLETYIHFLRRLISATLARIGTTSIAPNPNWDTSTALTYRLMVIETQRLARDPFTADRFREAIDRAPDADPFRNFDIGRFIERMGLTPLERVIIVAPFLNPATTMKRDLMSQANQIVRNNFEAAKAALTSQKAFESGDLSADRILKLVQTLLCDTTPDAPVIDPSQRQALLTEIGGKLGPGYLHLILKQVLPRISLLPGTTLPQALIQLGPDLTADVDVIRALLARFGINDSNPPRDIQALEVINRLARYAIEGTQLCDVRALVKALSSYNVTLQWDKSIRVLDRPERTGIDTATLKLIVAILSEAPHAVKGFWHDWSNSLYQLRLIDALLSLPADTFSFFGLPGRTVVTVDDVANASPTIKTLAMNVQASTWNSLELFELLVRLGGVEEAAAAESGERDPREREGPIKTQVREMLDRAVRVSAELVHMGLLQVPKPWPSIHREYANRLLTMFLAGHPNHQLVFMRIWQIDPQYLLGAFRDHYSENPINITRILDVAQDLKVILEALLEVQPFAFALDVAALASRREYLNLDKWLADHAQQHGLAFIREMVEFLRVKVQHEHGKMYDQQPASRNSDDEGRMMLLNAPTVAIFIRAMRAFITSPAGASLTTEEQEHMLEVRNICLQAHPRLMSLTPGSDVEPGTQVVTYAPEVENEVEDIYRQLYANQLSVENLLEVLQSAKISPNAHDHEVFAGVLHTVFDEYKFYPQYPSRELMVTAHLFGSLIQNHLVENVPLGIAIRYVLAAIGEQPPHKLFTFGLQALARFQTRLVEFPGVCHELLTMTAFVEQQILPDLPEAVRRALRYAESGAAGEIPGQIVVFNSVQPDILDPTTDPFAVLTEPSEEVSDKILFIVNNLAPNNFENKTEEMKEWYSDGIARWFAKYLVEERVSAEPNNHPLYLRFLDTLSHPVLSRFILYETYVKSARLLNDEATLASATDRQILRNLASWLGALTLARDRPIKYKNMSLKDLLIEGYESQRLIVAIPFVCKLLESAAHSQVFRPPNPWLMRILGVLMELYYYADLKLNLKFEIEVLVKELGLSSGPGSEEVEVSNVLRSSAANRQALEAAPETEINGDTADLEEFGAVPNASSAGGYDQATVYNDQILGSGALIDEVPDLSVFIESLLLEQRNRLHFEPELEPFIAIPRFLRLVQSVFEQTTREVIQPVVERSASVAAISAQHLVSRDYAMEADELKMQRAAHLMAKKLATGLALVTAKDVLRTTLVANFRNEFADPQWAEFPFPEQYLILLIDPNIDLACAVVESVAIKRALHEVDRALEPEYEARRLHRIRRSSQPFWNPKNPLPEFANSLPLPLRIRPQGVTDEQSQIYEDFNRVDITKAQDLRPRRTITQKPAVSQYARVSDHQHALRGNQIQQHSISPPLENRNERLHQQPSPPPPLTFEQCIETIERYFIDFEGFWVNVHEGMDTSGIPNGEDLMEQVYIALNQSEEQDRGQHFVCQKLVQGLLSTKSEVPRQAYAVFLRQLQAAGIKSAMEAVDWFITAEDKRKYNLPAVMVLIAADAINLDAYDESLAQTLFHSEDVNLIHYAVRLIRNCLLRDPPIQSASNFARTLEALKVFDLQGKAPQEVPQLMEQLRVDPHTIATSNARMPPAFHTLYPKLEELFIRWVQFFQGPTGDRDFLLYAAELEAARVLKSDDTSAMFFRVCVEVSVDRYIQVEKKGAKINPYLYVDALSRLLVLMIKFNGEESNDKAHILKKILSIVTLVLSHQHEEFGPLFHQKPFFRFFSSLLSDLHAFESSFQVAYYPMMMNVCETLQALQPVYFPGFVFSWMALISHRLFLPQMLITPNGEGWPAFHRLLVALFKFAGPVLKQGDPNTGTGLRQGILRILLLLLHDFPEFLSANYYSICEVIPTNCVQMRNIVLSAFPETVVLPDPHPGGGLRALKEGSIKPFIASNFLAVLSEADKYVIEQRLDTQGGPNSVAAIYNRLRPAKEEAPGYDYDIPAINATVLYIGTVASSRKWPVSNSTFFNSLDPSVVFLKFMVTNLEVEGQHHFVSAMALHLRFPSRHTFWFSSLIIFLFKDVDKIKFKEVVTKVLLERVLCHRPHPWGVVMTLIELVRQPGFFQLEFISKYPEIQAMLHKIGTHVKPLPSK